VDTPPEHFTYRVVVNKFKTCTRQLSQAGVTYLMLVFGQIITASPADTGKKQFGKSLEI
jgi:hypothetical protein